MTQGDDRNTVQYFIDPADTRRSLLALISNRTAFAVDALVQRELDSGNDFGLSCFSTLVAGSNGLDAAEQRLEASSFRLDIYHVYVANREISIYSPPGLQTDGTHQRQHTFCRAAAFSSTGSFQGRSDAPVITLLKKKGRRAIENTEDIMLHLRSKYKGVEFEILKGEAIAAMSIKHQVSYNISCGICIYARSASCCF